MEPFRPRAGRSWVQIPVEATFYLLHNVKTGISAHPAPYSVGTGHHCRPQRDVNHSPQSIAEVRNEWSDTSAPPIGLHGLDKDNV